MNTSIHFRVWRPCRWEREYLDVNKHRPADITSFQECIYSWEPFSNIFDSITNSESAETLKISLLEDFAPAHPPGERVVEKLSKVINNIDDILQNGSDWTESQKEFRPLSDGKSLNLREHQLLALRQHIQWVYDTFKSIPYVNVTFR
jgi:hypothetical protein